MDLGSAQKVPAALGGHGAQRHPLPRRAGALAALGAARGLRPGRLGDHGGGRHGPRRREGQGVRVSKISKFCKILQILSGLVLGCIKTQFCKKICV